MRDESLFFFSFSFSLSLSFSFFFYISLFFSPCFYVLVLSLSLSLLSSSLSLSLFFTLNLLAFLRQTANGGASSRSTKQRLQKGCQMTYKNIIFKVPDLPNCCQQFFQFYFSLSKECFDEFHILPCGGQTAALERPRGGDDEIANGSRLSGGGWRRLLHKCLEESITHKRRVSLLSCGGCGVGFGVT